MTATQRVITDGLPTQLLDVDAESIVVQVLARLAAGGKVDPGVVAEAAARYRLDDPDNFPVGVSAGGAS